MIQLTPYSSCPTTLAVCPTNSAPTTSYAFPGPERQLVSVDTITMGTDVGVSVGGGLAGATGVNCAGGIAGTGGRRIRCRGPALLPPVPPEANYTPMCRQGGPRRGGQFLFSADHLVLLSQGEDVHPSYTRSRRLTMVGRDNASPDSDPSRWIAARLRLGLEQKACARAQTSRMRPPEQDEQLRSARNEPACPGLALGRANGHSRGKARLAVVQPVQTSLGGIVGSRFLSFSRWDSRRRLQGWEFGEKRSN